MISLNSLFWNHHTIHISYRLKCIKIKMTSRNILQRKFKQIKKIMPMNYWKSIKLENHFYIRISYHWNTYKLKLFLIYVPLPMSSLNIFHFHLWIWKIFLINQKSMENLFLHLLYLESLLMFYKDCSIFNHLKKFMETLDLKQLVSLIIMFAFWIIFLLQLNKNKLSIRYKKNPFILVLLFIEIWNPKTKTMSIWKTMIYFVWEWWFCI